MGSAERLRALTCLSMPLQISSSTEDLAAPPTMHMLRLADLSSRATTSSAFVLVVETCKVSLKSMYHTACGSCLWTASDSVSIAPYAPCRPLQCPPSCNEEVGSVAAPAGPREAGSPCRAGASGSPAASALRGHFHHRLRHGSRHVFTMCMQAFVTKEHAWQGCHAAADGMPQYC